MPVYAAMQGNMTAIQFCLENGININAKSKSQTTPFHYAAQKVTDKNTLCFLLNKGADCRATNSDGSSALHFATKGSNAVAIDLCLEEGMDINQRDNVDITPFHIAAAFAKDAKILKLLLQNKADINATDKNGGTALHFASMEGNLTSIRFCLENGLLPRINDALKDGATPLDLACKSSNFEVVELLVTKGAFISEKTLREALNKKDILAFLKAGN
jgi:ankyrin repeat protein